MDVQFGPNSVDEPNVLYKLQRKVKVFGTSNTLANRGYNLVTSCSKYGVVFVAPTNGSLLIYYLKDLVDKETEARHITIKLHENVTHIAVSCDQELLAVTGGQFLCIYKITDFQNQNVAPSLTLKCEVNSATFVSALQWNPCIPDSLAIAFFDGTLLACQVSTSQLKKIQSKCRCLCWSPKGKQFVTGNSDGTLTQYKPDLTPAKTVPAPKLFEGAPVEVMSVYWISTFQFAVVYKNASDNSRPAVTVVNTPKGGQLSCLNYEDICYSMGASRPWYFYLQGLAPWNIILSSSSNSMEIATLGSADGTTWMQWCQSDEARPELPLTDKKQENYPVGICIDTCAVHQLPWGENETLPFMPMLLVLSQTGLLTLFNIINLNKQAASVCTPPQPIMLPATAMTAVIPDSAPAAQTVQTATPAAPVPQPAVQHAPQVTQPVQTKQPITPQFGAAAPGLPKPVSALPQPQAFAPNASQGEQKQPEVKPSPQSQPTVAAAVPKLPTTTASPPQPTPQMQEAYAAMKAEQDRIKAIKANEKLRSILVTEYNNFQLELHKFMVNTKQTQTQHQQDIEALNLYANANVPDAQELKNDKTLEELRNSIVQLKLELVRACAVVAEARTHADAKVLQEWSQADPLTMKRVASVKKLAYYVQNQVEQAHRALDYKWNEIASRDTKLYKPGQRMIRPVLDDVYQPLVKQQEILSRQEAVLRLLKNTYKEIDDGPVFKTTSLLRSTPFKNKDSLSKLTKNILNMSIEPQAKPKESQLDAQKLDALRDMLSNHKTIKVKPVNIELRQQLATMRLNHDKNIKEKLMQQEVSQAIIETVVQPSPEIKKEASPITEYIQPPQPTAPPASVFKFEHKQEIKAPPMTVPSATPLVSPFKPTGILGTSNVARTLFMNDPKHEPVKPFETPASQPMTGVFGNKQPSFAAQPLKQVQPQQQPFAPAPSASANTKSVLKDLLQQKQAKDSAAIATALIQNPETLTSKICSPSSFSLSSTSTPATTPPAASVFTVKPISDINNMFTKFTSQPLLSEYKPTTVGQKSSETGEPEAITAISISSDVKKNDKPVTNLFANKLATLASQKPPTDTKIQEATKTDITTQLKIKEEESKENIPDRVSENKAQESQKISNEKIVLEGTPLAGQKTITNMSSIFTSSVQPAQAVDVIPITTEPQKAAETKPLPVENASEKPDIIATSKASSLFAAANASSPAVSSSVFSSTTVPTTQTGSIFGTAQITATTTTSSSTEKPSLFGNSTTSSASSIFGAAVASQPKTTQTGSVFGTSTSSTPSSIFGSSTGSIFGTATTTSTSPLFGSSTVTSSESKSSVFSTTPITTSSVFGATTTQSSSSVTASQSSVFGSSPAGSLFGSPTTQTSTTTTPNVFGTATTQSSVFGTPTSTTQSIFGAVSSQASMFGNTATTAQSVFGSPTTTTQSSIFGSTPSQPSIFGSPTATQGSIFGSPSAQTSIFGTPTQSPQASVFGTPPQTTQASVFGTPPQTTQASVFGSAPATTTQSSLFGGAESNLFAAASISTTSSQSPSAGGNIFGSTTGSVFGNANANTNVFGGNATFSQSNPTTASIFGGGTAFGQSQGNNSFWSGGTASTGFGSGFGQQATTQASSIFSGGSGGSFSSPTPAAQPFGSPQQSAFGGGDNKPSIFGSPQQQNASAFGGSSVFGAKPAFGQSASFGSATSGGFGSFGGFNKSPQSGFGAPASFGGGATFGGTGFGNTSPNKAFGGSSPGFGTPTQSNATFESLATQNTLTFGNLAQQQPQAAPTFNTSPSFTGWRG